MPYTAVEIAEYGRKLDRSRSTLFKWVREGCNLRDDKSVREWVTRNTIRETNISKARKRRRDNEQKAQRASDVSAPSSLDHPGNGELPPIGKKGAQHALARLEAQEAESHTRLQAALARRNPVEIQAAQEFWVRCVESLRKLDLSIELARRDAEEQVPKRLACDVAFAIADWLRISFAVFLSSETLPLMGLRSPGEFKHYAFERFRSILHMTLRNSLKTNGPIPDWAASKVTESWNIPTLDADGN